MYSTIMGVTEKKVGHLGTGEQVTILLYLILSLLHVLYYVFLFVFLVAI